jgi:hypothetical protein
MPVRAVSAGADFVEINDGGRVSRVAESDVAPGSKDKMALAIQSLLQEALTTRIRVRDLPDDEPTKTTDPAAEYGERMFWDGQGINKSVVSHAVIVESVVWDGTSYVPTLRRAR